MIKMPYKLIALILLAILVCPVVANAWDLQHEEFHVANGFKPVSNAFTTIALIFSSPAYQYGIWVLMILGFAATGSFFYMKNLVAGDWSKFGSVQWMVGAFLGILIYISFFMKLDSCIWVYDDVQNEQNQICGLPSGVVASAGLTNLFEKGVSDIIWGSNIQGLSAYSGGIGFQALLKMSTLTSVDDMYVQQSMQYYINDCVMFELRRHGSSMDINTLVSNSTDLINDFGLASNQAVQTTVFGAVYPQGDSTSCQNAYAGGATDNGFVWTGLFNYYTNATNFQNIILGQSSMIGFDPVSATTVYPGIIQQTLGDILGGGATPDVNNFARQSILANNLESILRTKSPDVAVQSMANTNQMLNGISGGVIMNDWMPVIRAVVISIVISVIPFIVIFIPSGLVGSSLKLLFGSFVWLAAWGIMDALTTSISQSYALDVFQNIRNNSLGVYSIINMPTASQKALVLF